MFHPTASERTVCPTISFSPIFYHFPFTTEKILKTCEPYARENIYRDINTAWDEIESATVDGGIQAKN